jgi:hypothetical protein
MLRRVNELAAEARSGCGVCAAKGTAQTTAMTVRVRAEFIMGVMFVQSTI